MITRRVQGRAAALTWRHFAAAAIAAAIAVATAQPAWASWAAQNPPSPGQGAQFNGVSCTSATACVAVGSYTSGGSTFQLAATSNGSAWTENDPANPAGATNTVLNGISCVPGWCLAVGTKTGGSGGTPVSQRWTGSGWTAQTVPVPGGATSSELNGVSCTASSCVAVGSYTNASGTFPLAEGWNGSAWSLQTAANPSGSANSQLYGVSCAGPASCVAVGASQSGDAALAEALTGTTWSLQTAPNFGAGLNTFDAVSCVSATSCVATGTGLAATLSGSTWTVANPAKPKGDTGGLPNLVGVSCTAANECTAVGNFYDDAVTTATAEQWNGTAWKVQDVTVADSDTSGFDAVSCPAAHLCTGTGWFQDTVTNQTKTMAQVFSLNWQDQNLGQLNGTLTSSINSISCGKYCTDAGTVLNTDGTVQGIVMYQGVGWSYRQTASLSYSAFSGIWCTTTEANCFVVGRGSGPVPLAEYFNGVSFAVQATPLPTGATDGAFNAVSCSSTSNCLAVGFYDVSDTEHALAEAWNGTAWTVVDPPVPAGSTSAVLSGVSCTASSCVAVGNYDNSAGQHALAGQYTGGTWTVPSVPLPSGASSPYLSGVSCPSASACLAVGAYDNGAEFVPLAEKWNGTKWAYQTPPAPPGSTHSGLSSIDCTSASACVALGNWYDTSNNSHTLAEGLTSGAWGVQATPTTGTTESEFLGVSCPSVTACTGVGDVSGSTNVTELVELYS